MKKFFKVLLIILVIGGAIGATCFFFFKNLQKEKDSFAAVNEFVYGVKEEAFNANIAKAKGYVESYASTDERFEVLESVSSKLMSMAQVLDYYLLNVNAHQINQNKIVDYVNELITARDNCDVVFDEFFVKYEKHTSEEFKVDVAANALFNNLTIYLQKYASFVNCLNTEIANNIVSKTADVKFDYFEIYTNCIENLMQDTETSNGIIGFKDSDFIFKLNSTCNLENGQIKLANGKTSYNGDINKFMEFYSKCNAINFASNLKENLATYTTITDSSTNEAKATYYFIALFVPAV